MRRDWPVRVGTPEEIEAERRAYWRSLTPSERLAALDRLLKSVYGPERRLGRVYRVVDCSGAEPSVIEGV